MHSAPPDALSAPTQRRYAGDWADFCRWCRANGHIALPGEAATLEAYVSALAETLGRGALDRRLAAIVHAHRAHDLASPLENPELRARLRALKKQARKHRRIPPPTPEKLERMAQRCPGDLSGLRDQAVLLLASLGLGRAALVGLDAEDVCRTAAGVTLTLRVGPTPTVTLPREAATALQNWMAASDCAFGPVFRKVDRWGHVEHRRLGTDALRRIFARRAQPAKSRQPPASVADPGATAA